MKLIIPRDEWLHGEGSYMSSLLRADDNKRCCVGHYLKACGISDELLLEEPTPTDCRLSDALPPEAKWLLRRYKTSSSSSAMNLYMWNDSLHITEEERENYIRNEFAKHGVEVTFE